MNDRERYYYNVGWRDGRHDEPIEDESEIDAGAPADWQPIETAPMDGTLIIGLCVHDADPYFDGESMLTTYGAHCEGLSHVPDGVHILEWGGEYSDYDEYTGTGSIIPNWWFRHGSEFEEAANPTHWMPLPPSPPEGEENVKY